PVIPLRQGIAIAVSPGRCDTVILQVHGAAWACPPSRSPHTPEPVLRTGGVRTAGHGWPAAGSGSTDAERAGGAHPCAQDGPRELPARLPSGQCVPLAAAAGAGASARAAEAAPPSADTSSPSSTSGAGARRWKNALRTASNSL